MTDDRSQSTDAFSERIAFEPFKQIDYTQPIKVMPLGTWYRGDRKLTPDEKRAQEMVANFKQGLPRYGVKVNIEHGGAGEGGKVGKIKDVFYKPGVGVYALTEFTDIGKKLLEEERYDGVSPEVVWTLNNDARYQDPQTGTWHDNVLVGLALTNSAYFGDQVAVFSARPQNTDHRTQTAQKEIMANPFAQQEQQGGPPKPPAAPPQPGEGEQPEGNAFEQVKAAIAQLAGLLKQFITQEQGDAANQPPAPPQPNQPPAPMPQMGNHSVKGGNMADQQITVEEFAELQKKADELTAKVAEAEQFKAQAETLTAANKKLAEDFAAERLIRRSREFNAEAERFNALPGKVETLGAELLWLNDADPTEKKDHFTAIKTLLETANAALAQSALFSAMGTARGTDTNEHPFLAEVEKTRVARFNDKPYAEGFTAAMKATASEHKDLARQYHTDKRRGAI